MSGKNQGAKVLKSVMIGTVALTPVIAIGLNANEATAAENLTTGEKASIKKFIDKFNALDADKKELIRIVMQELAKDPSQSIEADYQKEVGPAFKTLLTFDTVNKVTTQNLEARYSDFKNAVRGAKEDVTSEDLVTYFDSVIDGLAMAVGELKSSDYRDLAGSGLYDKLLKVYEENAVPASLKPVIKRPDFTIISGIQSAFNAYLPPVDGGGGGGIIIPPTTPPVTGGGAVEVDGSTVVSNPQAVIDIIEKAAKIEVLAIKVPTGSTEVEIPATILAALDKKNSDAVVVLQFGDIAYELPVNAFDLAEVAKDLEVTSIELKLNVSVEKVDNPLASKTAYKVLADAFDFNVSVVAPGGKSVELHVFPTPIKRTLPAVSTLNPHSTVGVTVDANGKVTAVPTYVNTDNKSADLYRSTNSVYTLIEHSKSFTDITAGTSWAEEYVDKLASRMVVNGKTQTTFAPTLKITRGEFAAILSRGLGIVAMDKTANSFKDVSTSQAFNQNGEIAAVVEAGIVAGYTDGTFRPYEEITRDQAAIMISRAIDYVGADKVTFDTKKALTAFKDSKEIGAASRKHVERVYQAGLLDGYVDNTFRPNADANRGQMAKIIYNFLAEIKFIN
ncbi:S-layer homology domain-containing protein [Sporosarcina koreensis]|uniref:S-layer homology domain-containing protein n=1 Tax=Sporosarcina koreensis TaxID=334735 RepID=A0ABW0U3V2_9BACL